MYQDLQMEFGAITAQLGRTLRDGMLEALEEKMDLIVTVVKEFEENAARIRGNSELSDLGKSARVNQAASASADRLQHIVSDLSKYDKRIAELQAKAAKPVLPANEMVRELRACEIRTHYSALDPLALQAEALAMAGDTRLHERLAAILDAPVPLLDPATAEKAREAMAAAVDPETGRLIHELRVSHDAIASAVRSAMGKLHAAGLPKDDPIARIAAQGVA
jgi:hypothetical protein